MSADEKRAHAERLSREVRVQAMLMDRMGVRTANQTQVLSWIQTYGKSVREMFTSDAKVRVCMDVGDLDETVRLLLEKLQH